MSNLEDIFNYLVVFDSIILGLAASYLLDDISKLIPKRNAIKFYWVHSIWIALILLSVCQYWWGQLDDIQTVSEWRFWGFLINLIPLISLFIISDLAIPDISEEVSEKLISNGKIDFYKYYYIEFKKVVFPLFSSYLFFLIVQSILLEGKNFFHGINVFRCIGIGVFILLFYRNEEKIHSFFC
ncbi:MAG: hypothetical protein AAFY41_12640, partial [Bacteroidota bacterium]